VLSLSSIYIFAYYYYFFKKVTLLGVYACDRLNQHRLFAVAVILTMLFIRKGKKGLHLRLCYLLEPRKRLRFRNNR
jgi:hypothetical protein